MYSKVFEFDQKVQAGKKITFAWYAIQQQPQKKVKFHDLSNFAVILHFFNKIRIVVVRFFKKKLFDQRSRNNKTYVQKGCSWRIF